VNNFTVRSVADLTKRLAWLRANAFLDDHAIWSTAEELFLDDPLSVSSEAGAFALFFGVKNNPTQRLKLVCRNAKTALIIRRVVRDDGLTCMSYDVQSWMNGDDRRVLFGSCSILPGASDM
jgi:hypothetical protein